MTWNCPEPTHSKMMEQEGDGFRLECPTEAERWASL
eukprot:CAMPEP_0170182996 /NCGR_PEP_ID=MMETSP0040_2-20121228/29301_1 /TAXON_ID=641309 /ORGANISM="Lotharella oceanica, Strain CCMP622" /LENGTH=35 /DNA_ID= /DNA_START= /DNA_END= /DNA_ORIENTATION=